MEPGLAIRFCIYVVEDAYRLHNYVFAGRNNTINAYKNRWKQRCCLHIDNLFLFAFGDGEGEC